MPSETETQPFVMRFRTDNPAYQAGAAAERQRWVTAIEERLARIQVTSLTGSVGRRTELRRLLDDLLDGPS